MASYRIVKVVKGKTIRFEAQKDVTSPSQKFFETDPWLTLGSQHTQEEAQEVIAQDIEINLPEVREIVQIINVD